MLLTHRTPQKTEGKQQQGRDRDLWQVEFCFYLQKPTMDTVNNRCRVHRDCPQGNRGTGTDYNTRRGYKGMFQHKEMEGQVQTIC